jgi:uncharacterized membrane protein
MDTEKKPHILPKVLLIILTLVILIIWLVETPPGLLGKADAVGYAVCHQISSHSFHFGERPLSLCARCSGMHLGIFFGLLFHLKFGKKGGLPSKKFLILMGIFLLLFAIDGTNSYLTLPAETGGNIGFPIKIPTLYTPQNWLRLVTGTLLGLSIAALIYPLFNQTIWKNWDTQATLSTWKDFGLLLGIGAVIDLAVLSNNILLLYPLTLISAFNVLMILMILYSIIWTMIFKKENTYETYKEILFVLLLGFCTALAQIALMDLGRYLLTGSWEGFSNFRLTK